MNLEELQYWLVGGGKTYLVCFLMLLNIIATGHELLFGMQYCSF